MDRLAGGRRRGTDPLVSPHTRAVGEALFVTFLWSTSYVFIAIGLEEIPAITFAGLRYAIATLVLLPLFAHRGGHHEVRALSRRDHLALLGLGILLYAVTQGAQFVALQYIPAATVSLALNFTPVVVALVSVPLLGERATLRQWAWIGVLLVGVGLYFYPFGLQSAALVGLGVMVVGVFANAFASVLGRHVNRDDAPSALAVTTVSMGIGSALLLLTGGIVQGVPPLSLSAWGIVLWLALVNTAFAFTLWNRTLQTLSATESSVVNNTMLVQIAILGWIFLGESLTALDVVGIVVVSVAAAFVQLADRG